MRLVSLTREMSAAMRIIARVGGWVLVAAILALSFVPPTLRPDTGAPHDVEHFAIFCATGMTFGVGYRSRRLISIALVAFAGAVEFGQIFVPDRHARLSDFVVDAAAACIGVLFAAVAARAQTKVPNMSAGRVTRTRRGAPVAQNRTNVP
jgi:hypothetical protein